MLRRKNDGVRENRMPIARGGVSFWSILTGAVVALGAMVLLSAITAGVLDATGTSPEELTSGDVVEAGIVAGIVFVVAQFLSYLWGGYTAGRMARGAGALNGLLVPIVALLLVVLAGAIAGLMIGGDVSWNLPWSTNQLPFSTDNAVDYGVPVGIAALVAMLLGGILGGILGSNWHNKLERRAVADRVTDDERRDAEIRGRSAAERESAERDRERLEARDDRTGEPVVTRHEDRPPEKPTPKDRLTGR